MKKQLRTLGAVAMLVTASSVGFAQQQQFGTCGTKAPDTQWENVFQQQIKAYESERAAGKQQAVVNIPVIVHVVHNGTAVGTAANLKADQIKAQMTFLNDLMAGSVPWKSTALPSTFTSADAGDIPIRFCLATKDAKGNTLAEPGIERIDRNAKGWSDPATSSDPTSLFDNTIKPATIWDPTKYFNIWVGDYYDPAKGGLLGYATFPANSTLSGLTSNLETSTTSGVVMASRVFGCKALYSGGYYANEEYSNGVTTAHEVGHYLGLRHIGGDTQCGDDYCADTPPQKGGNNSGQNGQNWGCPTHPFQKGGCSGNTTGEMFMNYMDYTNDKCRALFTKNQATRMLTAMQNAPYRKALGTHGLCNMGPSASFTANKTAICPGESIAFSDNSGGSPTAWKWTFTGGNPASSTQQNPTVTYASPGNYQVKLTVTNSLGADSVTKTQYVVVDQAPAAPTGTDGVVCQPGGIVNLSATGSGTLEWYTAQTGGSPVATGPTYSPNISSTTTYYVGVAAAGATQKVGATDKSIGAGGYFTANNDRRMYFDVTKTVTIKTVKIDANTAGDRTIEILDANGAAVATKTVTLVKGLNTATLNVTINPGTGYAIKLAASSTNDLYRNTDGANYPYSISGVVSITGTDAATTPEIYYYYFYDWEVSTTGCPSVRTPVKGTVDNCTGLDNSTFTQAIHIYPNPSNGQLNISGLSTLNNTLQVEVRNTLGQLVYQESIAVSKNVDVKQVDISRLPAGVYLLRLSSETGAVTHRITLQK